MDKTQADAIAQAILEPDIRVQEELKKKRAAEILYRARKRRVAWFALVGFGIGVVVAYFGRIPFITGFMGGGIAGTALGWLATRRSAV